MLLVFLTPRRALSSLAMPTDGLTVLVHYQTSYNIAHTQKKIQRPTAAHQWHFALQDVSHRQSWHLSTPSHPQVPLL